MEWKKGKVKFDDGSIYPAELLISEDGQIWNSKVFKDRKVIEEIDADNFALKLGKSVAEVYPYTCEIDD
ncbi:hypothetical protein SH2C18_06140 [Clostridium sediminicola]|uniref:hypothetical protein n=1 Tax=Clostridium sediminicola TaxID=3114879 RepID=UPI0031F23492